MTYVTSGAGRRLKFNITVISPISSSFFEKFSTESHLNKR